MFNLHSLCRGLRDRSKRKLDEIHLVFAEARNYASLFFWLPPWHLSLDLLRCLHKVPLTVLLFNCFNSSLPVTNCHQSKFPTAGVSRHVSTRLRTRVNTALDTCQPV